MRNPTITIQGTQSRTAAITRVVIEALEARNVVFAVDDSDTLRTGQVTITVFSDEER